MIGFQNFEIEALVSNFVLSEVLGLRRGTKKRGSDNRQGFFNHVRRNLPGRFYAFLTPSFSFIKGVGGDSARRVRHCNQIADFESTKYIPYSTLKTAVRCALLLDCVSLTLTRSS